ncbi:tryptophan transporter [Bacillus sp. NPDC077027]|uniref:tryptophan transporter n=1 Tax=Bacillus sp. NPDC077027 TaxID=3390548 RepID=UPI003D05B967
MKTKELVIMALLAAMGAVLHTIFPPIFFGMKPDMMLVMMFLSIILFPKVQHVIVIALVTGAISALTTGFPGGQIPNMIDKPVTAFIFLALFLSCQKIKNKVVLSAVLTAIGTIVSGVIFLSAALVITGLPVAFPALLAGVVLPATVINTIAMLFVFPIAQSILKRARIIEIA